VLDDSPDPAGVDALKATLIGSCLQRRSAIRTQRDRDIRELGTTLRAVQEPTRGISA